MRNLVVKGVAIEPDSVLALTLLPACAHMHFMSYMHGYMPAAKQSCTLRRRGQSTEA